MNVCTLNRRLSSSNVHKLDVVRDKWNGKKKMLNVQQARKVTVERLRKKCGVMERENRSII